jgi:hypothetical protein
MKALFFGVVTLFLIVGMSNDAQAACNAACRANCRATHQHAGLTYDQCVAIDSETCPPYGSYGRYAAALERFKAVHGRVMTTMEIHRWSARCGCGDGPVAGGLCYGGEARGP